VSGHPLDNPIWSALSSRLAHFGEGGNEAKRFNADVSPFAAAIDASAQAVASLGAMVPAEGDISLLQAAPPQAPPGVTVTMSALGLQMVAQGLTKGEKRFAIEHLGDAHAAEMLELATLTRPGPFRTAHTHWAGSSAFATTASSSRWRVNVCARTSSSRSAQSARIPTIADAATAQRSCAP
jgi:hypothetical protein